MKITFEVLKASSIYDTIGKHYGERYRNLVTVEHMTHRNSRYAELMTHRDLVNLEHIMHRDFRNVEHIAHQNPKIDSKAGDLNYEPQHNMDKNTELFFQVDSNHIIKEYASIWLIKSDSAFTPPQRYGGETK